MGASNLVCKSTDVPLSGLGKSTGPGEPLAVGVNDGVKVAVKIGVWVDVNVGVDVKVLVEPAIGV